MQTAKILVMGVVAVSAQTGKNACGNKSPFGFVDQSNTVVVDSSFPPVAAVSMGMDMMEGADFIRDASVIHIFHYLPGLKAKSLAERAEFDNPPWPGRVGPGKKCILPGNPDCSRYSKIEYEAGCGFLQPTDSLVLNGAMTTPGVVNDDGTFPGCKVAARTEYCFNGVADDGSFISVPCDECAAEPEAEAQEEGEEESGGDAAPVFGSGSAATYPASAPRLPVFFNPSQGGSNGATKFYATTTGLPFTGLPLRQPSFFQGNRGGFGGFQLAPTRFSPQGFRYGNRFPQQQQQRFPRQWPSAQSNFPGASNQPTSASNLPRRVTGFQAMQQRLPSPPQQFLGGARTPYSSFLGISARNGNPFAARAWFGNPQQQAGGFRG